MNSPDPHAIPFDSIRLSERDEIPIDSFRRTVAITANRNLEPSDFSIIDSKMKQLVADPLIKGIIFGGARGGDTVALTSALKWRNELKTRVKFMVVVPNQLKNQPESTWTASKRADVLVELKELIVPYNGYQAYRSRNEYMVDRAHEVVAFWNGQQKSGTYSCICYARKSGRILTIVNIKGTDT